MFEQPKQITDEMVRHITPTNVKSTPINIILPKRLPHRDDNVWITSPIKVTKQ